MLNIKAAFARQRSLARGADNGAQAEEQKRKGLPSPKKLSSTRSLGVRKF